MNIKKVIGILLVVGGITMIGLGAYISGEVDEGKHKISSAQEKVDTGNSLFSMSPATKEFGKGITGSAQKKIDEGKDQVSTYEAMSQNFKWGGIIVLIAGAVILFISRKKSKR
ncbi:MAG: hypothetical protein V4492_02450 [Chlamydiota bacterium]